MSMINYEPQIKAADKMANMLDRYFRDDCTIVELTAVLLEYRASQALVDKELAEAFEALQKELQPVLDYESKMSYREIAEMGIVPTKTAKNSKKRS